MVARELSGSGGGRSVLYLGRDVSYMGVYICQNIQLYTYNSCILLSILPKKNVENGNALKGISLARS